MVLFMRKGQEKILKKAAKYNYKKCCIKALSREDLTLKQLYELEYMIYCCRDKTEEWIALFLSIEDYELMNLIISYMRVEEIDISVEELRSMTSRDKICEYFSQNGVICRNLFDVAIIMNIGFHNYTAALFNYNTKICESDPQMSMYKTTSIIRRLANCLADVSDYDEFLDGIDIDRLCQNQWYLDKYITDYINSHTLFKLKDATGIPKDIQNMNFNGYTVEVKANGYSRRVQYDLRSVYINCKSFSKVIVSGDGSKKANTWEGCEKKLVFINKTQTFITGYSTKKGYRYKPTQLKTLFSAISICDTDEDSQNAYGVIDFLCKKYNTYIFKDLYEDFLESEGLLLPILITEAAQYKTKQELFYKHYKLSVQGNWNRRNANLTYVIQKLKPRLTEEALARAMQCKNVPKIKNIGKRRYIMTYILYEAIYGVTVGDSYGCGLLSDALYEEYNRKIIKLLPERQTINEHNARQINKKAENVKFKIKGDTKFKKLIKNMPVQYELIKTPKRLAEEGFLQKNCVAGYHRKIDSDECMIYSVKYENARHTIEIVFKNGRFEVAQCFKSCNNPSNPMLLQELDSVLSKINDSD